MPAVQTMHAEIEAPVVALLKVPFGHAYWVDDTVPLGQ
jgi:hypothetical protein